MTELLVIADDITGAMDTGVQFLSCDIKIHIAGPGRELCEEDLLGGPRVLIIDTESRHLPPDEAGKIVCDTVKTAVAAGVSCIYKKVDSALRGNIGSELAGALSAAGGYIHFVPAFPQMGRVTKEGIHYIDGEPVAESVFGKDPFEPVRFSSIEDIIASQSDAAAMHASAYSFPWDDVDAAAPAIVIYDASTDAEMQRIAGTLKEKGQLRLLAGCAGFASVLARMLFTDGDGYAAVPAFVPRLLSVSGSINPITAAQLDYAQAHGSLRIVLTPEEKLDPAWPGSTEAGRLMDMWADQVMHRDCSIIECGVHDGPETESFMAENDIVTGDARKLIAKAVSSVLKGLLDRGVDATLLVTGGDTLLSFMYLTGQEEMTPICQLMPGTVLTQIEYGGRIYNLISKSGGFGSESILIDLKNMILCTQEEDAYANEV